MPAIDYDRVAPDYARERSASPRVLDHLTARLAGEGVRALLEVGCGTGNHLAALSRRLGARGYGFDRSEGMLRQAAARGDDLVLRRGDAASGYPFGDAEFDLVLDVDMIHYVDDLVRFYAEGSRVLRPGALMVTVTNSRQDFRHGSLWRYFPPAVAIDRARFPTLPAIRAAMRLAGFRDIAVTRTLHREPLPATERRRFAHRAYSELLLLPDGALRRGLRRVERDLAAGRATYCEPYTYIWGRKPAS